MEKTNHKCSESDITYIGMIEIKDSVQYIQRDEKYIYAGTVCNLGFIEHCKVEIDDCFSLDENLQAFIESIEEELI